MLRKLLLPLLTLSLVFWTVGCSNNPENLTTTPNDTNLNSDFGGYTATAEKPAFDDPELVTEVSSDVDYADPILNSSDVDSMVADTESGYYHLRIIWGQLRYDSTVNVVTDWTGSLSITRGAEIIRRVIRFEPGQDYILPRTDRKLIEWVSKTTVHNDGIGVDIVVPPIRPIFDTSIVPLVTPEGDTVDNIAVDTVYPDVEPVKVSFETGPYSRTFSLSEISTLDTIVYLDDSNAVAFHGLKLDRRPCPRGFLMGYWGHDENSKGIFKGVWTSRFGRITGFLKGNYGVNDEGRKVFFGKWINRAGNFEGFIKGTYGERANENANMIGMMRSGGWFAGKIYNSNRAEIGALHGKYKSSQWLKGGFFQGRWKTYCEKTTDSTDNSMEKDGF